jgi:hypothetical protein
MVDMNTTQVAYTPKDTGNDTSATNSDSKEFSFFGDDGFTFLDFVDMVNPLQHIPVVSTAYRQITGDELDHGARLAGGTLFGGPIGFAASAFNVLLEHNTGKDVGDHVVAWFDGEEEPVEGDTMIAQNGSNPNVSSFAPVIPESEADAFAAGEASLRMAELEEFMNPALSKEVPFPSQTEVTNPAYSGGAGSAGVWTPPTNVDHPFPTERSSSAQEKTLSSMYQTKEVAETPPAAQPAVSPQAAYGFQAKQSHDDSLDALRAFARDVKAQQMEMKAAQTQPVATPAPTPVPPPRPLTSPTQLSQIQDNGWFASMMSENMTRYAERPDIDG